MRIRPSWARVRNVAAWIVVLAVLFGLFRVLVYDWYSATAGSMKEAIRPGDILIVNKMAYGYSRYSCPWSLCAPSAAGCSQARRHAATSSCSHIHGPAFRSSSGSSACRGSASECRAACCTSTVNPVAMEAAGYFEETWEPQARVGRPAGLREPAVRDRRNLPEAALLRDAAGQRAPYDPGPGRRPCGQHARVHGSHRGVFRDGRSPGQQRRQPVSAGRRRDRASALREPDRACRRGVLG